jgi:transcriptional regulator with XRE-family HTH domain
MDARDSTSLPLFRRLRDARRAKGLTQCALAEQAGCKQSALSMMESGRMEALAHGTIVKIAEILGVVIEPVPAGAGHAVPAVPPAGRSICPSFDCPSNVPFVVNGEVIFWPRRQPTATGRHCVFCGEVLAQACRRCGAPITEGACCPECGAVHVLPPEAGTNDIEQWAERRRRQIADWRALHD